MGSSHKLLAYKKEFKSEETAFSDLFPIIILEKKCVLLYTRMQASAYCTEDGIRPICSGQKYVTIIYEIFCIIMQVFMANGHK